MTINSLRNFYYEKTFAQVLNRDVGTNNKYSFMPQLCGNNADEGYRLLSSGINNDCATALWHPNTIDPNHGFILDFQVRFSNDGDADGLCFVLQNGGTTPLGGFGGRLGLQGNSGRRGSSISIRSKHTGIVRNIKNMAIIK